MPVPRLLHTVLDTDDVRGTAEFWRQLLDLRYRPGDEEATDGNRQTELDEQHERVLELGGELRLDRTDTPQEPLRAYADPAGHAFCIFVA